VHFPDTFCRERQVLSIAKQQPIIISLSLSLSPEREI
jgi:hypothetical protein